MAGGDDPDCRRTFPPIADWDCSLLALHKRLIALRQAYPVLRTGAIAGIRGQETTACYLRTDASTTVLVAVNAGAAPVRWHVKARDLGGDAFRGAKNPFGTGTVQWEEDGLVLVLPSHGLYRWDMRRRTPDSQDALTGRSVTSAATGQSHRWIPPNTCSLPSPDPRERAFPTALQDRCVMKSGAPAGHGVMLRQISFHTIPSSH